MLPRLPRWVRQWGPRAENFRTQGPSLPCETPGPQCCQFAFQMHDTAAITAYWHKWILNNNNSADGFKQIYVVELEAIGPVQIWSTKAITTC